MERISNSAIAASLLNHAQQLAKNKESPFKVKAYRRAAKSIETMVENVAELVRTNQDLTEYPGIGKGIEGRVREIVLSGNVEPAAETRRMLLPEAGRVVAALEEFLLNQCKVRRVEVTGDYRRRVETIGELSFLIDTDDLPAVLNRLEGSSLNLNIETATKRDWGVAMIRATGSAAHLDLLGPLPPSGKDEVAVYRKLGLSYIEPELREGRNELTHAGALVSIADIRGELHAHSTSSDGAGTIDQMARAALAKAYEYTGITDHSQSLKIARGLSPEDLREQLKFIDKLNAGNPGILILKSSEVDILADGTLDYPDDLLRELDYTVCSIHSKFAMNRAQQTERILRAMDNPYFTILGHATGRRLLNRPGYEIDIERILKHARSNGCFVEINSIPERLDLSSDNARLACAAGVKIAINTDAHSTREYDSIQYGISQARRAGLRKDDVLNTRSWPELKKLFRRA